MDKPLEQEDGFFFKMDSGKRVFIAEKEAVCPNSKNHDPIEPYDHNGLVLICPTCNHVKTVVQEVLDPD